MSAGPSESGLQQGTVRKDVHSRKRAIILDQIEGRCVAFQGLCVCT